MRDLYEVCFRGQNAFEAGAPVLQHEGEMRAWKPTPGKQFECDVATAKNRFNELVEDGIAGRKVDGVVPFVVELRAVRYRRREDVESRSTDTLVWQYAEQDSPQWGQWVDARMRDDEDREPSGGSVDAMAN